MFQNRKLTTDLFYLALQTANCNCKNYFEIPEGTCGSKLPILICILELKTEHSIIWKKTKVHDDQQDTCWTVLHRILFYF